MTRNETRLMLRLPDDLAEHMRQLAAKHDRSLNGELIQAVRVYVDQRETADHGTREQ